MPAAMSLYPGPEMPHFSWAGSANHKESRQRGMRTGMPSLVFIFVDLRELGIVTWGQK